MNVCRLPILRERGTVISDSSHRGCGPRSRRKWRAIGRQFRQRTCNDASHPHSARPHREAGAIKQAIMQSTRTASYGRRNGAEDAPQLSVSILRSTAGARFDRAASRLRTTIRRCSSFTSGFLPTAAIKSAWPRSDVPRSCPTCTSRIPPLSAAARAVGVRRDEIAGDLEKLTDAAIPANLQDDFQRRLRGARNLDEEQRSGGRTRVQQAHSRGRDVTSQGQKRFPGRFAIFVKRNDDDLQDRCIAN